MKEIYKRRSIRKFSDKKVEKDTIEKILKAGMNAPSAMNLKPYEYVVVTDRQILEKL
ncbi:MAG: nitroreductase family protein [Candidatus Peribacteria bacterium]|jgi:nitroreductase|nr:nitroreductase family protein [Candidatus Peribacteria bacterium]